ncbi:hypothetical protein JCM18899A_22180 [Nocardioides sp. AN3]
MPQAEPQPRDQVNPLDVLTAHAGPVDDQQWRGARAEDDHTMGHCRGNPVEHRVPHVQPSELVAIAAAPMTPDHTEAAAAVPLSRNSGGTVPTWSVARSSPRPPWRRRSPG